MQQAGPGRPRARGPDPAQSFRGKKKKGGSSMAGTATSILPKQARGSRMSPPGRAAVVPHHPSESGRWVVAKDADCAELGGGQGGAHGLGAARPSAAGCSQGAAEPWRAAQADAHWENIPAQVRKPLPEEGWRSGRSKAGASCIPPTPPPPSSLPGSAVGGLFLSVWCSLSCKAASRTPSAAPALMACA